MSNDTKFKPGNPGRPVGTKNVRTQQWEALHASIVGEHCEQFNAFMHELWSGDMDDRMAASELYIKMLEYFKPKQARQVIAGDNDAPLQIVIGDKI